MFLRKVLRELHAVACIRHLCAAVNAHKGDFAASRVLLSHFLGISGTRPEKRRRPERRGLLYRREGDIGVTRKKREEGSELAVQLGYGKFRPAEEARSVGASQRWSSRRLSRGFFHWCLLCFDWRPSTRWLSGSARKTPRMIFGWSWACVHTAPG